MATFDAALWNKIAAFPLDDAESAFPFSARLARDMHWTSSHARRVVAEYRRFLYLACTVGQPVTPSEDVDAVWHLHLTYSRSYWRGLCRQTLGRPLHHGPTRGGAGESARFAAQYEETLAHYRAAFGAAPPRDIWPEAAVRFAPRQRAVIDLNTHWAIPKQPFHAIAAMMRAKVLLVGVLIASSGAAIAAGDGKAFLGLSQKDLWYGGAMLGAFGLLWLLFGSGGNSGCSAGCGPSSGDSGCGGCGGD